MSERGRLRLGGRGQDLRPAPGLAPRPDEPSAGFAPEPRTWTVGQVNRAARRALERLARLWVVGEVANFHRHRSGHCYFTLKDRSAQLSCVMFRRDASRLPVDPEEGMTLRVFGGLTLYEARGAFQLVARKLEAEREGGMWKLAFDRLKRVLDAEGLTSPERKRPLPTWPRALGVATSPGSAAMRDVTAAIARRAPWVRLVVRGTSVQGKEAAPEVAAAVAQLGRSDVDAVLVARGGGSIEDLWAFNEEAVARAVAACPVPVISGVGHETDVTICDLVADVRAATPSAAAEIAAPERRAVSRRLDALGRSLAKGLEAQTRARRWRLDRLGETLARLGRRRASRPLEPLHAISERMARAMDARIRGDRARLAEWAAAMEARSPLSTLARGYAVPLDRDGRLLRAARDFPAGRDFVLRVVDATVDCAVAAPPRRLQRMAAKRQDETDR